MFLKGILLINVSSSQLDSNDGPLARRESLFEDFAPRSLYKIVMTEILLTKYLWRQYLIKCFLPQTRFHPRAISHYGDYGSKLGVRNSDTEELPKSCGRAAEELLKSCSMKDTEKGDEKEKGNEKEKEKEKERKKKKKKKKKWRRKQASKQASKQAEKQASKQASKQARKQSSNQASHQKSSKCHQNVTKMSQKCHQNELRFTPTDFLLYAQPWSMRMSINWLPQTTTTTNTTSMCHMRGRTVVYNCRINLFLHLSQESKQASKQSSKQAS